MTKIPAGVIALVVALLTLPQFASAQSMWMGDSLIANYLREKSSAMRASLLMPGAAASKTNEAHHKSEILGGIREVDADLDQVAEAEVFATMNPADSTNIIISPINTASTLGVVCPIYYTKDFGRTWKKSSFTPVPIEQNTLVGGGGDPMFTWGADGKLYMAWIDIYFFSNNQSYYYNKIYWASSSDGGATFTRMPNGFVASGTITQSASQAYDKEWLAADRSNSPFRGSLYAAIVSINRTASIQVRRMIPNGTSFNQLGALIAGASFTMVQFPNVVVDPKGGVHCTFFGSQDGSQFGIWHSVSNDGGVTFSTAKKAVDVHFPGFSPDDSHPIPGIEQGRQYPCPNFTIDTSQTSHRGFLYLTWCANGTVNAATTPLNIYFSRSTDNGATWSTPSMVNDDAEVGLGDHYNPSIAVNRRGIIGISWYDRRTDVNSLITNAYTANSYDGGLSFATNQIVSSKSSDHGAFASNQSAAFGVGDYAATIMTDNYTIPVWCDARTNDGITNPYAAWVPIDAAPVGAVRISSPTANATLERKFP